MASRLEVIRSNKGHHKVIHLGFMYTKHKAMGDKIRWRCVQRGAHCKGSIFTSNDFREPRVTVNHNHMPDFNAVEFARSRTMFADRLAMFHPLEVVELNRETTRTGPARLKQEQSNRGSTGRLKQEPTDSSFPAAGHDAPSTSAAAYPPPRRRSQAPLAAPPAKPLAPPPKRPLVMKPLAPKPRPVSPPQPPPPPPEVCLRWNSYHSNMQATFPALLVSGQFVDVTLACEGRSIKCHKMILSACSSYFDQLLTQNPCQHPIVLMKDLKFWEVQALVDFMYRGEVNVSQDKLPFLLAAAEALQIKGLASLPGRDDDSASAGTDDFLDDLDVPSPASARRARRRRTIATLPPQQAPVPAPTATPTFRSARLQRNNGGGGQAPPPAQPSTSGFSSFPREPPTRKRKLEPAELDVGDQYMREIKLEPVDIDASNDSLDQSSELFQITCDPTPCDPLFRAALEDRKDAPACAGPPAPEPADDPLGEPPREEMETDRTVDETAGAETPNENGPIFKEETHIPAEDCGDDYKPPGPEIPDPAVEADHPPVPATDPDDDDDKLPTPDDQPPG